MKKMGKQGIDIIQLDRNKLIDLLNKAYADEWFAYYQYWVAAKIVTGVMRPEAVTELEQHAADELKHAGLLAERMIQLDGQPLTNINSFSKFANCQYIEPTNIEVKAIIQQAIDGERCAIAVYNKLLSLVKDKDEITYHLILDILKEEIEHETDFVNLMRDHELSKI